MQWKKRWNKGWHMHGAPGGGYSIGSRLALYWLCLVLAALAAALFLLSVTGVLSRTARQFGETAALQQKNTAAVFISQMDILTAQGIELSEAVSGEMERFLACRSLSFEALNDAPDLIAALESQLIPTLKTALAGSTCSGVYFCLDATANTALPGSKSSRMGVYLRYSSLRSAHPSGSTAYFRGTVAAARENGLQLHNRWNPELDTSLIPGYRQVMSWEEDRLSGGCLWTGRGGRGAGHLRHGAERALLQPVPSYGLQPLRQLPDAAGPHERGDPASGPGDAGQHGRDGPGGLR